MLSHPLDAQRLTRFNSQLLDQALALAAAHESPEQRPFAAVVGPHLRHVIEHFEALLAPAEIGVVDYDRRPRDRAVERSPYIAARRIAALQARLAACAGMASDAPLKVRQQGGLEGEVDFELDSSFGRELAFVASHAVHHFALLKSHCAANGIATDARFGQAPATLAHARTTSSTPAFDKDPSCQDHFA